MNKIINILTRMNVYDPIMLFNKLSSNNCEINKCFQFGKHIGGKLSEIVEFTYNDTKFNFFRTKTNSNIHFHIYPNDDDERNDYCVYIIFDFSERIIRLDLIAYNGQCFKIEHHKKFGKDNCKGSLLLKMAISFIKRVNEKYKIKYITLRDTSYMKCRSVKISLGRMSILMDGNTWYGRYGFVPQQDFEYKIDEQLLKKYKENIKIIKKSLVSDISNFKMYLKKIIYDKANEKYIKNIDTDILLKSIDKFQNKKISWFMKEIIIEYDKSCYLFYLIYDKIFNDLGLYNFTGKSFIIIL